MLAYLEQAVYWLRFIAEGTSALIIGIGLFLALYHLIRTFLNPSALGYNKTRLVLSRFLALALEFQLASDVLGTAISPSWTQLGQLAVIATIRTLINYFLEREMKEEEATIMAKEAVL